MNILVLGGGGFIGSTLVKTLLEAGHSVRVFDRNAQINTGVQPHEKIDWIRSEFEDEGALQSSLAGVDLVFHLMATTTPATSNQSAIPDISGNVLPSIKLLEIMKKSSVRRIVFISSGGTVYGAPNDLPITELHPTNPIVSHGIHKLTIEKYLLLYKSQYNFIPTIVRLSNPYGPNQIVKGGQGVVGSMMRAICDGGEFELWGDGSAIRDYIYIDDVVGALLKIVDYSGNETILNLSSSVGVTVHDLARTVAEATGKELVIAYRPGRSFDISANILDNSLAKRELDWSPKVTLFRGIQLTYDHMKSGRGRRPPV